MEIIDLVRKSSGVIIGVVKVENDFAAYLKARSDAVRFDLNADLGRGDSILGSCFSSPWSRVFWKTRKSS